MLMKRVSGAQAGDDVALDFTYNSSLALGTYMPLVEFKNDAGSYVGANGLANYYRIFSVVDATGIDTEVAQRDVTIAADLSGNAVTIAACPGVTISRVVMTAASGAVVWAGQPTDGRIDMTGSASRRVRGQRVHQPWRYHPQGDASLTSAVPICRGAVAISSFGPSVRMAVAAARPVAPR